MKRIKKWVFRVTTTLVFLIGLLVAIVFNPSWLYANKTVKAHYTVLHQQAIDDHLLEKVENAIKLIQQSELYNPNLHFEICLNDGSLYTSVMHTLRGRAFAWGFSNKVVLQGVANYQQDYAELNGYRWNLTQLLAHEMTHCLQFETLGLWKSNPLASIPNWKWEGYPEYIARRKPDQSDLRANMERFNQSDSRKWAVTFSDSSIVSRGYYKNWLLTTYAMDIKKQNFLHLLADTTSEQVIERELLKWYSESDDRNYNIE
jgi:hypothetical protein